MSSTTLLLALVVLGFIGYYYYMLVAGVPFNGRRLWLMPVLIGFFAVQNAPTNLFQNGAELRVTAVLAAIGTVVGVFQGFSITVFRDARGNLRQQGSVKAALVLILSLPLRLGVQYLLTSGSVLVPNAGGMANSGVLFGYLAIFFAITAARALTMLARYPDLLDVVLGDPEARVHPRGENHPGL